MEFKSNYKYINFLLRSFVFCRNLKLKLQNIWKMEIMKRICIIGWNLEVILLYKVIVLSMKE